MGSSQRICSDSSCPSPSVLVLRKVSFCLSHWLSCPRKRLRVVKRIVCILYAMQTRECLRSEQEGNEQHLCQTENLLDRR